MSNKNELYLKSSLKFDNEINDKKLCESISNTLKQKKHFIYNITFLNMKIEEDGYYKISFKITGKTNLKDFYMSLPQITLNER